MPRSKYEHLLNGRQSKATGDIFLNVIPCGASHPDKPDMTCVLVKDHEWHKGVMDLNLPTEFWMEWQ